MTTTKSSVMYKTTSNLVYRAINSIKTKRKGFFASFPLVMYINTQPFNQENLQFLSYLSLPSRKFVFISVAISSQFQRKTAVILLGCTCFCTPGRMIRIRRNNQDSI